MLFVRPPNGCQYETRAGGNDDYVAGYFVIRLVNPYLVSRTGYSVQSLIKQNLGPKGALSRSSDTRVLKPTLVPVTIEQYRYVAASR